MPREKKKTSTEIYYGYSKRHYDLLQLKMPKGSKEDIKRLADEQGITMSRYILEAVEQRSGLKLTLDKSFPRISKKKED